MAKKATLKLIASTDIIVVAKKENPFTEGTGAYKRVQAVLASNGKTKADAIKKGAKSSTVRYCVNEGIVRVKKSA